ncbi:MAG: M56 family metallopeptidase [Paraglaciecola sp.]|uniref:M56 family metallopeptidase n=1 Tax=Paraglaciecola sp. TaxID=1920173 RepID=UPI00273E0A01|nr:M56 family metallopeptidase [Paraglaciecola sp.]MDP5031189.1 M56 family metallopeptidase [Paraglaciecola sp.]MDP5133418.1 M56 family metallopeptidase [Paraglaciecola sp.]
MIDIVATLGQSVFSAFCLLLFASLMSSFLYPIFQRVNQRLPTNHQSLATLFFALMAPLSAILAVVVLTHPAIAATIVYAHCHGTSCIPHVPAPITSSFSGAVLVALAALVSLIVIYLMSKTLKLASRRQTYLEALSQPGEKSASSAFAHYRLIESDALAAWCAGLFFPRVYISTALVKKLTTEQLHAVLAHEYGHVMRRDNLRKLLLKWASTFWVPKAKHSLRHKYAAQMEELADCDSATITGQTELVKEVYAMFRSSDEVTQGIYQHRHVSTGNTAEMTSAARFSVVLVYLLLALLFVVLTLGLTLVAHGLLEQL